VSAAARHSLFGYGAVITFSLPFADARLG
jgi:hypothetical protein